MPINRCEVIYLNTDGDKINFLANPINVEGLMCTVIEINGKVNSTLKKNQELFLCSDICQGTYVNGIKLPVLRQLYRNTSGIIQPFYNKIWLEVVRPTNISSVRLYITDAEGTILSVGQNWLQCSLLFIPYVK